MSELYQERWVPVSGFDLFYEVSDLGRVRCASKPGEHPKIKTPTPNTNGYMQTTFKVSGKTTKRLVHRVVMEAFVGPRLSSQEVNHINGLKHDNRLVNLEYCSRSENTLHAIKCLGRKMKNWHLSVRLSSDDANDVRRMFSVGTSKNELAKMFHVSWTTISRIINRETYNSELCERMSLADTVEMPTSD